MHTSLLLGFVLVAAIAYAQYDEDLEFDKRSMRNALVRFGRSSGGMRNALVRFGKRSDPDHEGNWQDKRNGMPQPFVRFGRSGQLDHMHDILNTLEQIHQVHP